MLQLTGLKKINDKNVYVKDSQVGVNIYLTLKGKVQLDIFYFDNNQEVAREFIEVDRSSLSFDNTITDPYNQLVESIENLLIQSYFIGDCSAVRII